MGTWCGTIVETKQRSDFWAIAQKHHVTPGSAPLQTWILIDTGFDYEGAFGLAESLSRELGATALGFAIQTTSDVHETRTYHGGKCVRSLLFIRDEGGWIRVEGIQQPWELAYFFGRDEAGRKVREGGDMLGDELSEDESARGEEAIRSGDPTRVMDLLHPSSMFPMRRVCSFFEIDTDAPRAHWRKPTLWSRLFQRPAR